MYLFGVKANVIDLIFHALDGFGVLAIKFSNYVSSFLCKNNTVHVGFDV